MKNEQLYHVKIFTQIFCTSWLEWGHEIETH